MKIARMTSILLEETGLQFRSLFRFLIDLIHHSRARSSLLRRFYGFGDETVHFGRNVQISHAWSVKTGKHVLLNDGLKIVGGSGCEIGNYVYFSPEVTIITSTHDTRNMSEANGKVIIEDQAWIGYGAMILPGVIIRRGAVIAAGAVVTKTVEPMQIVGGCPARPIKERVIKYPYRLPKGDYYLDENQKVKKNESH